MARTPSGTTWPVSAATVSLVLGPSIVTRRHTPVGLGRCDDGCDCCRDDSDGRALPRTVDAMTVLGDTKELLKASADAAAAEEEAEAEEEADSK